MLDHLIHLELVVQRTGLEEEIVGQVLDRVSRREDVVAIPGMPLGVLGKHRLTDPPLRRLGAAVAYAQIAGLPPSAGLVPPTDRPAPRWESLGLAALSAALALVTAAVLVRPVVGSFGEVSAAARDPLGQGDGRGEFLRHASSSATAAS
jgi:hypothetical protein